MPSSSDYRHRTPRSEPQIPYSVARQFGYPMPRPRPVTSEELLDSIDAVNARLAAIEDALAELRAGQWR